MSVLFEGLYYLGGACAHYKEVVGVLEWNNGDAGEHAEWLAVALFNLGTLLADCHIMHTRLQALRNKQVQALRSRCRLFAGACSSQQALDYLEQARDLAYTPLHAGDNAYPFAQVFDFYSRKLASNTTTPDHSPFVKKCLQTKPDSVFGIPVV